LRSRRIETRVRRSYGRCIEARLQIDRGTIASIELLDAFLDQFLQRLSGAGQ
jgi:hypothetical protein